MRQDTDELLTRFRAGDAGAYETLWDRYQQPLRRFIKRHAPPSGAAVFTDDMMQETHLAALKSLPRFTWRKELSFFFWLCEIARRLIAYQRRKASRDLIVTARSIDASGTKSDDVIAALAQPGQSALDLISRHEHVDLLALGLAELSDKRRNAVVLRYVEGLSNEQAAAQEGVSAGAFRVTLSRALVDLRSAVARLLGEA